jgi:DNA uptake protein ComE-like DNA-binding protein
MQQVLGILFVSVSLLGVVGVVPCSLLLAQEPAASAAAAAKMTVAQKIAADQQRLDINTATPAQLKALPGMGDAYVARVIAGRPYTAKNQLVQRGILPQAVYAGLADRIVAHRPKPVQ